jgi:hypothetical protein
MYTKYRFFINSTQPKPIIFPPPGPYWISKRYSFGTTIICILPSIVNIKTYWPDATDISTQHIPEIIYTDRFPMPNWIDHI